MIGVVLCGGQSRRMGTDKGLLQAENKSWVQIAFVKLSTILPGVVISVNEAQHALYAKKFGVNLLIIDDDHLKVNGPLHGLLSVHKEFPGEDIFVLACDMLTMEQMMLAHLFRTFNENPGYECYLYKNENGYQPLAGIYAASLLSNILQQAASGELHKFSMKHVLDASDNFVLDVPVECDHCFTNYNYKEDIDFQ